MPFPEIPPVEMLPDEGIDIEEGENTQGAEAVKPAILEIYHAVQNEDLQ